MFHIILYCLLLNKDKDGAKKNNFVSVGCVITDKWSTIEHISCVRINHLQYNECYIDDMKGKTEKWWLLRWKQHFIFEELYGERFSGTNLPSGIRFLFSNLGFELRDRGSLSSFSFVSSSRFICVAMCIFFLHLITHSCSFFSSLGKCPRLPLKIFRVCVAAHINISSRAHWCV